eukprot:Nitzschia sp. Nitz4//scaffold20_size174350//121287//122292//NITZ4_002117-RA/size174350-snap-gene-0.249-mRNA-1//-1//CDS//3329541854//8858//frame0
MPSLQNAAPGSKSSKFTALNPFTPFLAQPGDLDGDDDGGVEEILSAQMDNRLRIQESNWAPSQPASSYAAPQQQMAAPSAPTPGGVSVRPIRPVEEPKKEEENSDDDSDDSDFDDDFDDDPALAAFRQRRLAELQKQVQQKSEHQAKGHGEVRTISQDEFLPECTSSKYVVVHFFHDEFERCKILDHHLKRIAPLHLGCKFVRISAEKAPFFVGKLAIKTLPTLLVFHDGKTVDRMTGFDALMEEVNDSKKNPDEFPTSLLGRWLEKTGVLEYEGPDSEDEDDGGAAKPGPRRGGIQTSRLSRYDDDN